jgi:hypothetical protein
MVGIALTVVVISALNETGPEYFGSYLAEDENIEEEKPKEDKEMVEKKMITPISSYNIVPVIEPESIEPDAFSGIESFSAF